MPPKVPHLAICGSLGAAAERPCLRVRAGMRTLTSQMPDGLHRGHAPIEVDAVNPERNGRPGRQARGRTTGCGCRRRGCGRGAEVRSLVAAGVPADLLGGELVGAVLVAQELPSRAAMLGNRSEMLELTDTLRQDRPLYPAVSPCFRSSSRMARVRPTQTSAATSPPASCKVARASLSS
jgi:hypothetical protein